jgi:hypothetical protein
MSKPRREACPQGHPYAEHGYYRANGNLAYCKLCARERGKRRRRRRGSDAWARQEAATAEWLERRRLAEAPTADIVAEVGRPRSSPCGLSEAADWVGFHDYAGRIPACDGPSRRSELLWLRLLDVDAEAWRTIRTEAEMLERARALGLLQT